MREAKYRISADRINERMKELDINGVSLSIDTGLTSGTISLYRSGRSRPSKEAAEKLGIALKCSPAWIQGYDVSKTPEISPENTYTITKKSVPLLGSIACGEPRYAEENFECYVMVGADVPADFCVRASGDSMTGARIQDGDIVFIRRTPEVENGKIAAVV